MTENRPERVAETVVPPATAAQSKFLASAQLVFGIVALQHSFITREQLIAVFDAWVQDKSRGLADLLVTQRALTEAYRAALDRLVALFLERMDPQKKFNQPAGAKNKAKRTQRRQSEMH